MKQPPTNIERLASSRFSIVSTGIFSTALRSRWRVPRAVTPRVRLQRPSHGEEEEEAPMGGAPGPKEWRLKEGVAWRELASTAGRQRQERWRGCGPPPWPPRPRAPPRYMLLRDGGQGREMRGCWHGDCGMTTRPKGSVLIEQSRGKWWGRWAPKRDGLEGPT